MEGGAYSRGLIGGFTVLVFTSITIVRLFTITPPICTHISSYVNLSLFGRRGLFGYDVLIRDVICQNVISGVSLHCISTGI